MRPDDARTARWIGTCRKPSSPNTTACEVSWYTDPANPRSQPPKSWKLYYRQGEQWKEVANPSGYGLETGKPNVVTFTPVKTAAMTIEVLADPDISAGPLEWKIRSEGGRKP